MKSAPNVIAVPSGADPRGQRREVRGFALIIVVSLLAFLVMVLVSLATITRIEAHVGANSRKQAQARQNATFALDAAIGELQRHAGADTRITASGDILPVGLSAGLHYWTGIWDSSDADYRAWMVSGTENLASPIADPSVALAVNPALSTSTSPLAALTIAGSGTNIPSQLLVGRRTAGTASTNGYIVAPLVTMTGPAPDGTANVTQGRYAWWIGDEGVKASLALRDRIDEVRYGPYLSDELRARLRQQVPMAHQGFRATGGTGSPKQGFDPALAANETLLANVVARNQIPFLTDASGISLLTSTRDLFHDWTTISSGVLASTNPAYPGLKRDLSRNPSLLGANFATWAGAGYMETPAAGNSASPAIASIDDVRRRYVIQAPVPASPSAGDLCIGVAPVLADFVVQFAVERRSANSIEVRMRICTSVWNPYTSALVPQDLRLAVSGLPTVTLTSSGGGASELLDLQGDVFEQIVGGAHELHLDWVDSSNDSDADFASWLPGRVYYWRTENSTPIPDLLRYRKRLSSSGGWPWLVTTNLVPGTVTIGRSDPTAISVTLKTASGTTLATTNGFAMAGGWSTPEVLSGDKWRFAFGFRLRQPTYLSPTTFPSSWLSTSGQDPRNVTVNSGQTMAYHPNGTAVSPVDPAYQGALNTEWTGTGGIFGAVLNRDTDGGSVLTYNNDTPLFELPRSPVLSLGMLQHLRVHGARPFAIGNSWGSGLVVPGVSGGGTVGSWWDRFYFSGLASDIWGPNLPGGEPLPWFHLRPIDTRASPVPTFDVSVLRAASPQTSRFLLMDGAFNVNSTSIDAWEAVLRSLRFTAPADWSTADLQVDGVHGGSVDSGTAVATTIEDLTQGATTTLAARTSGFLRFSQSAQETFETTGSVSGFDRSRFRQGIRGGSAGPTGRALTSTQMRGLAIAIVARLREKFAASGPFRTMEEFVSPLALVGWTGESLLDRAIADAALNAGIADFCTYTLTQADILTAIGPFLQCRSDTFLIRTYGETVNPVTQEVEARAWCEATVQRIPTKVDGTDPTTAATGFGRRFVITSFRWLSPDDI